jgi:ABC-type uncharacterized transport system auxiliary subunit
MSGAFSRRLPRATFPVIALALALAAGCGGDSVKRYYTLENTGSITAKLPPTPLCDRPVVVASVDVASPYDLDKIVFRSGTLEVRYYNQRHWVSPPEEMFTKLLGSRLESAHLFPAIESAVHSSRRHLSLFARLHRLEEVDRGDEWFARLALSMDLRDDQSETVLWRYQFDVTRKAPENQIQAVIEVLNEIYNEELDSAVASLERYLTNNGGCPVAQSM